MNLKWCDLRDVGPVVPRGRCWHPDSGGVRKRGNIPDWWPHCWMAARRVSSTTLARSAQDHLDAASARIHNPESCKSNPIPIIEIKIHSFVVNIMRSSAYLVDGEPFDSLIVAMATQQQFYQIVDGRSFRYQQTLVLGLWLKKNKTQYWNGFEVDLDMKWFIYIGHENAVVNADQSSAPHLNGEPRTAARVTRLQLGRARIVIQHQQSAHCTTWNHRIIKKKINQSINQVKWFISSNESIGRRSARRGEGATGAWLVRQTTARWQHEKDWG